MASTDINPNYITSSAVSKAATRAQLQFIKDCIVALEADVTALEAADVSLDGRLDTAETNITTALTGWRRLSTTTLGSAAASVQLSLPNGYSDYIVEFQALSGVADAVPQFRTSQDGSTFHTSGYDGHAFDHNATGTAVSAITGNAIGLFGVNLLAGASVGAFGQIRFVGTRNSGDFSVHGIRADVLRGSREGFFAGPGSNNIAMQMFLSGGAVNMNAGSKFDVLARL